MKQPELASPNQRAKKTLARRIAAGMLGAGIAISIWHLFSVIIASSLILPSPFEVVSNLLLLIDSASFWKAVAGSMERVFFSFIISIGIGTLTGVASGLSAWFKDSLAPLITTIRATPVLALILVAMFWLPSTGVPIFSAFLMAFPIIHTSVYAGVVSVDRELLEMATVFKVPPSVKFFKLRLPAARGHFLAGAKNALGLCWKVVVAGEVLSQPRFGLGTGLQDARLSLETGGVLAWAVVTVFLCGISEFALGVAAKKFDAASTGEAA